MKCNLGLQSIVDSKIKIITNPINKQLNYNWIISLIGILKWIGITKTKWNESSKIVVQLYCHKQESKE